MNVDMSGAQVSAACEASIDSTQLIVVFARTDMMSQPFLSRKNIDA